MGFASSRLLGYLMLIAVMAADPAYADQYFAEAEIGVELWLEAAEQDGSYYLQTHHIDPRGRVQVLMQPLQLHVDDQGVLSGQGWSRGRPQLLRLQLTTDPTALRWLAPKTLATGQGDTLPMARSYAPLDPEQRMAQAQSQFSSADRELNQAYEALRERMAAEDFAELRANQRRWLKFRDWFIADGDDAGINGPGTVPFLRQQTARTLARTTFLSGLGKPRTNPQLSGRYSDGMDRELRIRAIPTVDKHAFFSLISRIPALHQGDRQEPISVAGRASPDAQARSWTAAGEGVSPNPIVSDDSELLIEPALDFESVWLSSASSELFTERLYFIAELQPADEPMREVLLRLPATIFDHTTEGLSERAKTPLLLTGYYEPFSLSESGLDFARLSYAEGQVDLRRYPRSDGAALIAIATQNVRARQFELWLLPDDDAPARRLEQALPSMDAANFYRDGKPGEGVIEYELNEQIDEIAVSWRPFPDQPEPDYQFHLYWDQDGFGHYRSEN